ncbi:MAG: hypothetical protein KDD36_11105 [Flavobacteriales bacterium]|nr:hypothetical protein [Flavobacteriales bacterium]
MKPTSNKTFREILFTLIAFTYACTSGNNGNTLPVEPTTPVREKPFNELADKTKDRIYHISEANTDNPDIENIDRPDTSSIIDCPYDTSNFFGIWTTDPNGPHADFWWTGKSFYIVDYDGDGDMPFEVRKDCLIVYYNDYISRGKFDVSDPDSLRITWEDWAYQTVYVKWPEE